MTESVNSPATQPIQDKAPKPPGLMPKNVQTWAMLGLAVLMVSIMWLTGGKKPQTLRPHSAISGRIGASACGAQVSAAWDGRRQLSA